MDRPLAGDGVVRGLAEAAGAAPSIHNTQPWRLRVTDELIELHGDPDRMLWVADPGGRALHLSCGAALFNLRLSIRMLGAKPLVWPLPDPQGKPTLLASVELAPGRPPTSDERAMFDAIHRRHTSRAPFSERPIPGFLRVALEREAAREFAVFRMLNVGDANVVLDLAAAADRQLAADYDHQVELGQWIGTAGKDGVPGDALGYRPVTGRAPVRDFSHASPAIVRPSGRYERQPQLAVLSTAGDQPGDWLRAGQALQRVLLAAADHGLAASLLYQPVELHDMEPRDEQWWPWPECPQVIIRLGYGPAGKSSPRRGVDDILDRKLPER
jgi:nitroreductase